MNKPICENTFIIKKRDLKNDYFSLTFKSFTRTRHCKPGHFVHIHLPSKEVFFRRAFSIADVSVEKKELEVIFKIFGRGTRLMSILRKSEEVNLLGPLGVSFEFPKRNEKTIFIAGGIGFPPLLYLASEMVKKGHNPKYIEFFYGGNSITDLIERQRIKKLGVNFHPVTEDGSLGEKGLVTESVEKFIENTNKTKMRIYGCGPEGMLKAADALGIRYGIPGQISLEAPMPCGIGVCMGCVVPLVNGEHARVCYDGPVFNIGEVIL